MNDDGSVSVDEVPMHVGVRPGAKVRGFKRDGQWVKVISGMEEDDESMVEDATVVDALQVLGSGKPRDKIKLKTLVKACGADMQRDHLIVERLNPKFQYAGLAGGARQLPTTADHCLPPAALLLLVQSTSSLQPTSTAFVVLVDPPSSYFRPQLRGPVHQARHQELRPASDQAARLHGCVASRLTQRRGEFIWVGLRGV